jgi:hypothetical protein
MDTPTREHEMAHTNAIEIRLLGPQDGGAVARLAQLDSADAPPAPLLGGIADGRLVAAHSVATGQSIADPFRHTAGIRSLLAERAAQLRGGRGRGLLNRLRERLSGRPTHALRAGGPRVPYVAGSDHVNLLPRGRGL